MLHLKWGKRKKNTVYVRLKGDRRWGRGNVHMAVVADANFVIYHETELVRGFIPNSVTRKSNTIPTKPSPLLHITCKPILTQIFTQTCV